MTSAPSRCSSSRMRPVSGLPRLHALVGLLDAVHDGVAQHVLERRQHALEHLAVELAGGALDAELGALAGVGGGLAHDARQALHVALERHHARAHQAVLQLGDGARLLLQQVLRVLGEVLEQPLDAGHVVGGLGERARELLDRGVAVELERIEVAAVRAGLVLVPVQDLRLGLDLEVAQLLLQARHRARQLAEVEVERAELLLEAGARDAGFARDVEQLVEQLGVDARHFHALAGRRPARARAAPARAARAPRPPVPAGAASRTATARRRSARASSPRRPRAHSRPAPPARPPAHLRSPRCARAPARRSAGQVRCRRSPRPRTARSPRPGARATGPGPRPRRRARAPRPAAAAR